MSLQSCPTLCDPIDGSPPGSPVPGILQARTLEWGAISFSSGWKWKVKVAQSCPTLSDPMDCSPPGSSVHGIFQAMENFHWSGVPLLRSSNSITGYIPRRTESRDLNRYMYISVHSSIIHNSQKVENNQTFMDGSIDKQDMVYTWNMVQP